jgi:putative ABC transport system permease protein
MFKNYFKTAWRNLKRNKIYAAINISGIAIGLAAAWLITLYVFDELSYDCSFKNSDDIYRITQHATWEGGTVNLPLNPPLLGPSLPEKFPEVEQSVRLDAEGGGVIKFNNNIIKQNDIFFADNSFFKIFDHTFLYGDASSALTQPNAIVITESLAKKIFGDATTAFNQTINFDNDNPVKITGVIKDVPQNSHLQFSGIRSIYTVRNDENTWKNLSFYNYILLKKGTDVKTFEKKLNAFGMQTIAKEMGVKDYHMELQPLTSIHLHSNLAFELSTNSSMSRVYIFIAIGLLILLIALINYMNLSTARAAIRVKEIGIRKVIGSSRNNLAGLFVAEALLITFIAALIAFVLIEISMPLFNRLSGKNLDVWRFGTWNTVSFVVLFALLSGLISGSYPALFLSRFKMIPSLKGQLGNMQTSALLRKSLVVFQFVIAVFLISGSFIIYKQMQYVNSKDLGFNKEQVLTFHIDDMKVRGEIPALKNALLQSRLIESVGVAGNALGDNYLGGRDFAFEKNGVMPESSTMAKQLFVDEDFLKTMNIQLLQGRNFSNNMQTDQYGAMIINETLMKELGYTNAVGKKSEYRVNQFMDKSHRSIIGVVKDFHFSSLQHKIEPMVMIMPPAVKRTG